MSKFTDLKAQHPEWDVNLFDLIKKADPSNSNRYASFLFKCIKNIIVSPDNIISKLTTISPGELNKFHKHHEDGLIEVKDIQKYTGPEMLKQQINVAEEKIKQRELEKKTRKLHEDDDWLIVLPETYEAACIYGKKTKWCITQKTHWESYKKKYFFVMCINKKDDTEKYCFSKEVRGDVVQCWNAEDEELKNVLAVPIPFPIFSKVIEELKTNYTAISDLTRKDGKKIYWETSEGRLIEVKDMDTNHIKNVLRKEHMWNKGERRNAIDEMKRELERRKRKVETEETVTITDVSALEEEIRRINADAGAWIAEDGMVQPSVTHIEVDILRDITDRMRQMEDEELYEGLEEEEILEVMRDSREDGDEWVAEPDNTIQSIDELLSDSPATLNYTTEELDIDVPTDFNGNVFDRINQVRRRSRRLNSE